MIRSIRVRLLLWYAVVLTGELTEEEVRFHATAILASGGMVLSGDDLAEGKPTLPLLIAMERAIVYGAVLAGMAMFHQFAFQEASAALPRSYRIALG